MDNFLEGIQYRDLKTGFPTWNEDPYQEWKEITSNPASITFAKGTQFRVKPVYTYTAVVTGFSKETVTGNKDKVMAFAAGAIESGKDVNVSRSNITKSSVQHVLGGKNVQFSIDGNEWRSTVYLSEAGHAGRVKFRLRPDTYFKVRISSGITEAELTFDDIEAMLTYVNNKSRTTESNLTITREKYAR